MPQTIKTYGKIRIEPGNDIINASHLVKTGDQNRDVCFVRVGNFTTLSAWITLYSQYEQLVDIYQNHRDRTTVYQPRNCYGQLQQIFVLDLPRGAFGFPDSKTLLLGLIQACIITCVDDLDTPYYEQLGRLGVADPTTLCWWSCLRPRLLGNY